VRVVYVNVFCEVWREKVGILGNAHQVNRDTIESMLWFPLDPGYAIRRINILPCKEELSLVLESLIECFKILREVEVLHDAIKVWEDEIEMVLYTTFLNLDQFEIIELLWLLVNV
jgi:hypothetical protein